MTKLKGIEKRYIKPLPTIDNSLDNTSKKHVTNLLTHWLQELNIPMSWLQVLLDTVVFKLFEAFHSHHMTKEEKIHVQFFSTHMPNDSKFLIDVYHGNPLHFDGQFLRFPAGGTIRIYGLKEKMMETFMNLLQSIVYLTYCIYLETNIMRDHQILLTYTEPTSSVKPSPATVVNNNNQSFFYWIKKLTSARSSAEVGQSLKRRFSLTKPEEPKENPKNTFLELKEKMNHALISTSAGCKFPSPPLFDRLAQETRTQKTVRTQRRSSSFLSWKSVEDKPENNVENACLQHFLLDTESLASFKRHQSLIVTFACYPVGCADRPCAGPLLEEYSYFQSQSDHTLGQRLCQWTQQDGCPSNVDHYCTGTFTDHIYTYAHGNGKIVVYFYKEEKEKRQLFKKYQWTNWVSCQSCQQTSQPMTVSDESLAMSFAKYLELLLYDTRFVCFNCHAVLSDYHFHLNGLTIRLVHEQNEPYVIRIPHFQIPSTVNYGTDEPRLNPNTLNLWKRVLATDDVRTFFEAVLTHLDLLSHYIKAENRRKMRNAPVVVEKDNWGQEIGILRTRIEKDQQEMLKALRETKLNELNDFRRQFGVQSQLILDYLEKWQREKCQEVIDDCAWDKPDYIRQNTVHSFPGSSVLVREDEPTSIIAYTLSSNEYIQELIQEEKSTEKPDISAPNMAFLSVPSEKLAIPSNRHQVIDGYYSSIERKCICPSTNTESSSLRTMIIEVCKSSVSEERLEELKGFLPWNKKQEKQQVTESIEQQTKELKMTSMLNSKSQGSPHIQHKFVHNDTEFTCIVYYSNEFEALRRQYGIHQTMIESLCRCQPWVATGGKKLKYPADDRFVVKEMMNIWNVSEKDAFLKFAPKYFDHLKKSTQVPSVLAKIFGFFTIRIKNTQKTILNLDVLVMEHLFYDQHIIQKFDFKGIHDRQVEDSHKQQDNITLWDKDWIDGFRTTLLVQQKSLLDEAILNDTEFLSKCNIMDYSLLVGIDQEKREITIGIVDFIGAYTWYKKIESKGKSTISKKEVTIVPPDQYKSRFCKEIFNYFIPVLGKFDIPIKST
ncbi:hypothetical protein G6F43_001910 [Rhizopus delemar]|nr:hypothetical protein G6F43_001910 [Rhizopus delemar]